MIYPQLYIFLDSSCNSVIALLPSTISRYIDISIYVILLRSTDYRVQNGNLKKAEIETVNVCNYVLCLMTKMTAIENNRDKINVLFIDIFKSVTFLF